jgi:hypothetical protein
MVIGGALLAENRALPDQAAQPPRSDVSQQRLAEFGQSRQNHAGGVRNATDG